MAFVAICLVNYATAIIPSTPKGQQTFSGSISINYTTANGVVRNT